MTVGEGQLVDRRYRLVQVLGRGGMGEVWRAWDERLRRDVALKAGILLPGADDRTLREARAAAKLRHPGIVKVHDVFSHDDRPWIVMEYIEGRSLDRILRDGPLTEKRAAELAVQVVSALAVAHRSGVLHRDIKPSNIMEQGDQAVLTDFGIAFIEGGSVITAAGQPIGSWEYMAPERFQGISTPRADMWSVGIVLYEFLACRTPFKRVDMAATMNAIVHDELVRPEGADQLWPVIEGLLRKEPAERLTAEQTIRLLTELTGSTTAAKATPEPPSPTRIDQPPQVTDPNLTDQNTRLNPPAIPLTDPHRTERKASHGAVTIDPVAVPPRRRLRVRPAWITFGAAVAAGIVVAVIFLVPANRSADTPTAPPSTPSTPSTQLNLKRYDEPLGFSISVPADWTRSPSALGSPSDVQWQAPHTDDPKIGPLTVQVVRDDSGTSPYSYLEAADRTTRLSHDYYGYQRITLTDLTPSPSSELEYVYTTPAGNAMFHVWYRAIRSSHLYVVKFSLSAADRQTLQTLWDAAKGTRDAILGSFHPS